MYKHHEKKVRCEKKPLKSHLSDKLIPVLNFIIVGDILGIVEAFQESSPNQAEFSSENVPLPNATKSGASLDSYFIIWKLPN